MKILMLRRYYPVYFDYFYERCPDLSEFSFKEHREKLLDDHFHWDGDLGREISRNGIDINYIVVNDERFQKKWARENGHTDFKDVDWKKDYTEELDIVMKQVRHYKPDILWIGSMFMYYGDFVKSSLKYCKKVIAWITCPTPPNLDISGITTLVTTSAAAAMPVHEDICKGFKEIITIRRPFEGKILNKIGSVEKSHDLTFVGGLTPNHKSRIETLAYLIDKGVDIDVYGRIRWGNMPKEPTAPKGLVSRIGRILGGKADVESEFARNLAIIDRKFKGPVFGLDMYRLLASSRSTLNVHGDIAIGYSENTRMFEATGVGTCLITERTGDLPDIFEPDREVLTYGSKEELYAIVKDMSSKREKNERIAEAGQRRTLSEYTVQNTFEDIRPLFEI